MMEYLRYALLVIQYVLLAKFHQTIVHLVIIQLLEHYQLEIVLAWIDFTNITNK